MTQKRLMMFPLAGGGGIVNVTTFEPELMEMAITLLKNLRWHGLAQVEFIIDARDNKPKLIEINPKCWGTLDLAIQAGINFPHLTCKLALDGDITPIFEYQVGLKYRWLLSELVTVSQRPNKWRAMHEFIKFSQNIKYDLWITDPMPHIIWLSTLVKYAKSFFRKQTLLQRTRTPREPVVYPVNNTCKVRY
jgi:predicted ATP-grasp superfamily ATP-dependent carboligase